MPDLDQLTLDTRQALERVIRDPKAKPADIVRAAELLRAMGGTGADSDVLDLDDASLLAIAGGRGAKRGTRDGATETGPLPRSVQPATSLGPLAEGDGPLAEGDGPLAEGDGPLATPFTPSATPISGPPRAVGDWSRGPKEDPPKAKRGRPRKGTQRGPKETQGTPSVPLPAIAVEIDPLS
jgi:hypothetical protein